MRIRFYSTLVVVLLAALGSLAFAQGKTLRIAFTTAKGGLGDQQGEIFKKMLDQELPGYFNVKLYPGSQLGSGSENVQGVETGTLEGAGLGSEGIQVDPKLGIFDLPWIFKDFSAFRAATNPDGKFFSAMKQVFDQHGMVLLAIYGSGFRDVLTRKPVRSLDGFKGMKVRISVSPARKAFWETLGATPVAIEWADTYLALQNGTVDGVEAFPVFLKSGKMYEQAKYLDDIHYIAAPLFIVVSKVFWSGLSQNAQQALVTAGKDSMKPANDLAVQQQNADIKFMVDHGVTDVKTDLAGYKAIRDKLSQEYRSKYGSTWLDYIDAASASN